MADKSDLERSSQTSGDGRTAEASSDRPHRTPPPDRHESDHDDVKKPWYRRPVPVSIVIAIVIAVVVGGTLWRRHSRQYESTEDAFVDVVAQRVTPQVAGRVARVLVRDNEAVQAGQVLLELDPADFAAKLEQARAALEQAKAQVAQAEAMRAIRQADVEQARAAEHVAATNAENAASDLRRLEKARAGDAAVASEQQIQHTRAEQASTAAQQQAAQKAIAAAEAQLAYVACQIEAAHAGVQAAAAQVAQAQLTLSYAQVKARLAGRVADKSVTVGNYVDPGAELMAIVPREVYVTADFKETQLARIRPGQPVDVAIDAYPDLELHGRVDSIQAATGSAFTPIPAQNAAGNWVKVVQRVPVKITIDNLSTDDAQPLGPGMSATVKVHVQP